MSGRYSVVLVGGGALGSLFSAKLGSLPFVDVWMLTGWESHLRAIQSNKGLKFTSAAGEGSKIIPINATSSSDSIRTALCARASPRSAVDTYLVTVKSGATREAAQRICAVGLPAPCVTFQNGLGNNGILREHLPKDYPVFQGVTSHGARVLEPGSVQHLGVGPQIIGVPRNAEIPKSMDEITDWQGYRETTADTKDLTAATLRHIFLLAHVLTRSGMVTSVSAEVDVVIWRKLAVNASINALTALLRVRNGVLVESRSAEDVLRGVAAEVADVARATGVDLSSEETVELAMSVARSTVRNVSSMLSDVERMVGTEVEVINGAVVREGRRVGVPTPYNWMLYNLVKAVEDTYDKARISKSSVD